MEKHLFFEPNSQQYSCSRWLSEAVAAVKAVVAVTQRLKQQLNEVQTSGQWHTCTHTLLGISRAETAGYGSLYVYTIMGRSQHVGRS